MPTPDIDTSDLPDVVREGFERAKELRDEGTPWCPDYDPDEAILADADLIFRLASELRSARKLLAAGHRVVVGPHPKPPAVPDRSGHWSVPPLPADPREGADPC